MTRLRGTRVDRQNNEAIIKAATREPIAPTGPKDGDKAAALLARAEAAIAEDKREAEKRKASTGGAAFVTEKWVTAGREYTGTAYAELAARVVDSMFEEATEEEKEPVRETPRLPGTVRLRPPTMPKEIAAGLPTSREKRKGVRRG